MMQDVDRVLAEVATHAAAAGLDLESVREVLLANMLGEQPLPIDFRDEPPPEPEAAPVRVISE
jgi:heterodisulfide reductase subunit D